MTTAMKPILLLALTLLTHPSLSKHHNQPDNYKRPLQPGIYMTIHPCIDHCNKYGKGNLQYVNICMNCIDNTLYDIKRCSYACAHRFSSLNNSYDCDQCIFEGPTTGPRAVNKNPPVPDIDCREVRPGVVFDACVEHPKDPSEDWYE
jgi:hypothetical protein